MSTPTGGAATAVTTRAWRRARLLVVSIAVVFLVPGPIYVLIGYEGGGGARGNPLVVLLVTAGIAGIQLRHSLAVVRGARPAGWVWTFLALIALVYAPMPAWDYNWASTQWFVVGSALMLLRGPLAVVVAALPVLGTSVAAWQANLEYGLSAAGAGWGAVYWATGLVVGGVSLYGSVRLIRVLEELSAARAELAETAIGRERLRVSRDLHDLLGQSLSAVSLKGDLALALLRRDPTAARAEIEGLTEVARVALHDVRAITRDEHTVSLHTELDGIATLLTAAGIESRVEVDLATPAPEVEQLLAWAVREGVTNVLRHSDATACWVAVGRVEGSVRLQIVNDGVRGPGGEGSGLAGLAERARTLAGTVSAERDGDRFRLVVTVPAGGAAGGAGGAGAASGAPEAVA